MRLSFAIDSYIKKNRDQGRVYITHSRALNTLLKQVGDKPIHLVKSSEVQDYLGSTGDIERATWRAKYYRIRLFFEYWVARGQLSHAPLPPFKPPRPSTYIPYVYTKQELRRLFRGTYLSQKAIDCQISAEALRVMLIILYGTGMTEGEILRLKMTDLNLKQGLIAIRSNTPQQSRVLPIGSDIRNILRDYTKRRSPNTNSDLVFLAVSGRPIVSNTLSKTFRRLCTTVGITGQTHEPNIRDLRHSFAVHRITDWYKTSANLNRLLPALAAYLGQATLYSVNHYLESTPERFRGVLDALN